MKHELKKRVATFLSILLAFSVVPSTAWASEVQEETTQPVESVVEKTVESVETTEQAAQLPVIAETEVAVNETETAGTVETSIEAEVIASEASETEAAVDMQVSAVGQSLLKAESYSIFEDGTYSFVIYYEDNDYPCRIEGVYDSKGNKVVCDSYNSYDDDSGEIIECYVCYLNADETYTAKYYGYSGSDYWYDIEPGDFDPSDFDDEEDLEDVKILNPKSTGSYQLTFTYAAGNAINFFVDILDEEEEYLSDSWTWAINDNIITETYTVYLEATQTYTVSIHYNCENYTYEIKQVADSGTAGTVSWSYSNDVLTLSGTGAVNRQSMDASYPWEYLRSRIKTINIGKGITRIGEWAFGWYQNLTTVNLPDTIEVLELNAFWDCARLATINNLDKVETFEGNCLKDTKWAADHTDANGLCIYKGKVLSYDEERNTSKNVTIPNDVTEIGQMAFSFTDIASVKIGSGVTTIAYKAFNGCNNLTSIEVPSCVQSIEEAAFGSCDTLRNVKFDGNAPVIQKKVVVNGNVNYKGAFTETTTSGYYPTGNATWTSDKLNDYGGKISWATWVPGTSLGSITVNAISVSNQIYTGKALTPNVTVKVNGITLKKDIDYTVSYSNNTNVGKATVTVTGKGEYTGKASKTFTIAKANNTIKASNATKSYSTKTQTLYIKASVNDKAKLTYSSNNKNIKVDSNGKVTISKNYIGKATITIKSASTSYYNAASKSITVTVNPTGTSLSGLSDTKDGKATVKWKKNTVGDGYQIQYSTASNFSKNNKYVNVSKDKTTSGTISGLTHGTKYYVRIRTYKTVSGTKYYSGWSGSRNATISLTPEKVNLSSLKNSSKGKMAVKWKKNTKATGYEIQYSTDSSFKKGVKTVSVTSGKTTSKTITGLAKNSKYYVRIRTYKTVGGKKYYAGWSGVKNVTIKK